MGRFGDKRLARRAGAGETLARQRMVADHYEGIYRFLVHLCRNAHHAEDLTQETFVAACTGVEQFDGCSSMYTWLHRIAYNKFIDHTRRISREREQASAFSQQAHADSCNTDPAACLTAAEDDRRIQAAIERLADQDREMITMHYRQELSFRQMAEILNRHVGTIKWQVGLVLGRLRKLLEVQRP